MERQSMNFVEKVRLDIYEGRFYVDYNPRGRKLDHIIWSDMYIPASTVPRWRLSESLWSSMFRFKAQLLRDNVELDLTREEHKLLKKSILSAVEQAKAEYQQKQIRAKQYEK